MKRKIYLLGLGFMVAVMAVFMFFQPQFIRGEETDKGQVSIENEIIKQYGVQGYLGPMTENVKASTDEELKGINPDAVEQDTKVSFLEGRYNILPITDIYSARKLLYSLRDLLGISPDENTFLYGSEFKDTKEGGVTYRFAQMYQGVMVPEGFIDVVVDKMGNTENIFCRYKTEEEIGIASAQPKVSEEELHDIFKEQFQTYKLTGNQLYILTSLEGKMRLIWVVQANTISGEHEVIHIDANTGEEIVYHQEDDKDEQATTVTAGKIVEGMDEPESEEEQLIEEPEKEEPEESWPETVKDIHAYETSLTRHKTITYEQLLMWNPEKEPEMYHSEDYNMRHLYGRFTEDAIETDADVVNAIWSIGHWMGVNEDTDRFEVYRTEEDEDGKIYYLKQYYKGLRVINASIVVATDGDGYANYLCSNYIPFWDEDTEPEHNLEDIIYDMFREHYEIKNKELVMSGMGLTWKAEVIIDGVTHYTVVGDSAERIVYIEEEPYDEERKTEWPNY